MLTWDGHSDIGIMTVYNCSDVMKSILGVGHVYTESDLMKPILDVGHVYTESDLMKSILDVGHVYTESDLMKSIYLMLGTCTPSRGSVQCSRAIAVKPLIYHTR